MKVTLIGHETYIMNGCSTVFKRGVAADVSEETGKELLTATYEGEPVFAEGAAVVESKATKKILSVGKKPTASGEIDTGADASGQEPSKIAL